MNPTTQDFLQIEDIKDGILLLKGNQIRGVLMVSSTNFALKSNEEQDSIIYGFQSFLNSLSFSCQILIQSRHINVTPYLDTIKKLEEKQTNELLNIQTASYIEFIKELVKGENVMTKNFLVVVPYNIAEILGVGASLKKSALFDSNKNDSKKQADFEKCKNQLWQRMEFVASGLKRCELDAIPLTTVELVELFWAIHHPSEAEIGYYPQIMPELLK